MASIEEHEFFTVAEGARLCRLHQITVRRHTKQAASVPCVPESHCGCPKKAWKRTFMTRMLKAQDRDLKEDNPLVEIIGSFEENHPIRLASRRKIQVVEADRKRN